MGKERGPKGSGSKSVQDTASAEAKADSLKVGIGSLGMEHWINERGEHCIGNSCFSLAIKPGEDDVTIRVDRNNCDIDTELVVEDIMTAIGKGGRTLYESKSKIVKADGE